MPRDIAAAWLPILESDSANGAWADFLRLYLASILQDVLELRLVARTIWRTESFQPLPHSKR
jgi:hypothetical protein